MNPEEAIRTKDPSEGRTVHLVYISSVIESKMKTPFV